MQKKNMTEVREKEMKIEWYDVRVRSHGRPVLTLGESEETAETYSSTSLRGLFVDGGNMWLLTKVGVPGDGGACARVFLGGEPIPESGPPGIGYLVLSSGGALLSSVSKLAWGPATRAGERDSGGRDFRWIAFDRLGLSRGSVKRGEDSRRDRRYGGLVLG